MFGLDLSPRKPFRKGRRRGAAPLDAHSPALALSARIDAPRRSNRIAPVDKAVEQRPVVAYAQIPIMLQSKRSDCRDSSAPERIGFSVELPGIWDQSTGRRDA